MIHPYWHREILYNEICCLCDKKKDRLLMDAIDCVVDGSECSHGFEEFELICEECIKDKAETHLKEFHNSVDLV